ncbi:MAG: hypothetical protein JXA11_08490 [Phycisphaerae bacterium]|nr:hypothetical protein [Phycisphaerae bacterium]
MPITHHPLSILRLYNETYANPSRLERVARCIRENPGCFDDVWLSSMSMHAPREQQLKCIEGITAAAKALREIGVMVSLQIGETIGHGDASSYQPHGFEPEDGDWMIDQDGEHAGLVCCLIGSRFMDYVAETCGQYAAAIQPYSCYIDDDVRMNSHGRLRFGCFCPRCLELFSKQTGTEWTRESLVAALIATEQIVPLRMEWMKFNQQRMGMFVGHIAREVHRRSPDTIMGIETAGFNKQYNDIDFTPMYRALSEGGGRPARVRIGSGAYSDHIPDYLVLKALLLGNSAGNAVQSGCVDHICSEIENYPVAALSKSSYGTALEALLGIAFGCRAVSLQLGQLFIMPDAVPEKFFKRLASWRDIYETLSLLHDDCRVDGFNYYKNAADAAHAISADTQDPWSWIYRSDLLEVEQLMNSSLPVYWNDYEEAPTPYVVAAFGARSMDEADLRRALRAGVLFTGEAFMELERRGLTDFTGVVSDPKAPTTSRCILCDESFSGDRVGECFPIPILKVKPFAFKIRSDSPAVPLARIYNIVTGESQAVNTWRWEHPDYGRMAVFGMPGFSGDYNPSTVELFRDLLDYLGSNSAAVRCENCARLVLIPAVERSAGRTRAVTVLNVGIEPLEAISLRIRRPASSSWTCRVPEKPVTHLTPKEENEDEISLLLPELPAWGVCVLTAECDGE